MNKYEKKFIHYYTDDLPPLIKNAIINNKNFKSIADLGCGDGAILYSLNKKGLLSQFNKVYAVDLSSYRIHNVKGINNKIKCIISDVCHVSELKSQCIDLIISNQVVEHVSNDELMIKEIERILKKGGIVYVSTVFKKWYGWYFYRGNNNWVIDPTHVREYTKDSQLIDKFQKFNLEILVNQKSLQMFPVTDFILKRIGFKNNVYERSSILKFIRKVKLPILGYYNWEIVCKKK